MLINRVVGGSVLRSHTSKLGDFCFALGSKNTNFKQKIWSTTNFGTSLTSHCSNYTTMGFLRHSTACVEWVFCWKLVEIFRSKGSTKKIPQLKFRSMWPQSWSSHNVVYQRSHYSTLLIGCLNSSASLYVIG